MKKRTVTRADLSEAVFNEIGLSHTESGEIVESVLEEIAKALLAGDAVKLSSFGSFMVRHKKERVGRNPRTGKEVKISPRYVVTFRASDVLKDKVNHPAVRKRTARPKRSSGQK